MRVQQLIGPLLSSRAYRHRVDRVRPEETHIAWVLLAGRYAYKLKKPVNLGFVDFSTRERRADDCAEEVRLNRRLCPDVYLGVVDVVERDGELHMGGTGEAVEPAVKMRRLPAAGMLPNLLARDAVQARLMHRLARHLARFHATAATGRGVAEYGSPAAIRANWRENFVDTRLPSTEAASAAIERLRRIVQPRRGGRWRPPRTQFHRRRIAGV